MDALGSKEVSSQIIEDGFHLERKLTNQVTDERLTRTSIPVGNSASSRRTHAPHFALATIIRATYQFASEQEILTLSPIDIMAQALVHVFQVRLQTQAQTVTEEKAVEKFASQRRT